jgi:hypothetical protein
MKVADLEKMILVFDDLELVKRLEKKFLAANYEKNIVIHYGDMTVRKFIFV